MRALLLFFCLLLIYSRADSQKLVKKIDSLINIVESSNRLALRSKCDTVFVSHSDYAPILCDEFYLHDNKVFKIVMKTDRLRFFYNQKSQVDTIKRTVFYFENDSLIKVSFTDYSDNSSAIYHHYFTQEEIKRLKGVFEKYKDQYCQIRDWFEEVERLMVEFRQEK